MNNIELSTQILQTHAARHGGVFSLSDLKNLSQITDSVLLYRFIKALEKRGVIHRFVRGYYVAPRFDLKILSQRLCTKSYISLGNVLAAEMLIGSVPKNIVYAVKVGKNRTYQTSLGAVLHYGIAPHLFFGFRIQGGVAMADKEKAVLDTLYFYQLGHRFSFDVYSDIDFSRLDKRQLQKYLKFYRNPKFIAFVNGVMNG